jgi:uncharacterized damage-inducible protein DinB
MNTNKNTRYQFLVDTYETERLKVLSVWSMFHDEDLEAARLGRNAREHMIHQCTSENNWFREMFGIDVEAPPLAETETRRGFLARYAEDSLRRLEALRGQTDAWWEEEVAFFDVPRSRTWIMVRRIAHTAHHRGQQMALLRLLHRKVYSNYGPTADTGTEVHYAYPDVATLLDAIKNGEA